MAINSMDDFLNHGARSRGLRRNSDWKKQKGYITFLLHTTQLPFSVIVHPFPAMWSKTADGVTTKGWMDKDHVCFESEEIFRTRFFRNDDGTREKPPTVCPHCILQEKIWQGIAKGDIDPFQRMFAFDGATDPTKNRVVYAGGYCGLFGAKKILDKDVENAARNGVKSIVERMKDHGIRRNETFKYDNSPRSKYVMTIVDIENPTGSLEVLDESAGVGEAVKKAIRDTIEFYGGDREKGNPFKNPYAFKLIYNKDADPKSKYSCSRVEMMPGGRPIDVDRYRKVITEKAPSIDFFTRTESPRNLLSSMQKHLNPDFEMDSEDWQEVFGAALKLEGEGGPRDEVDDMFKAHAPEVGRGDAAVTDPRGSVEDSKPGPAPATSPATAPAGAVATSPCPDCDTPFPVTETKCPKCGAEFEADNGVGF